MCQAIDVLSMFSQGKSSQKRKKRGCLPPVLRASPEDIFGKMKDELNCDKVTP